METWRRRVRELAELVPAGDVPEAIGELTTAIEVLRLRALEAVTGRNGQPAAREPALDRHLSAREVAARLDVSEDWCYVNRRKLGGVKLEGAVRFPESALVRYVKAQARAESGES